MPSTDQPHGKTTEEMDVSYADLCEALKTCPLSENKHQSAILCIGICLENGIGTRAQIVETLTKLGFNHRHLVIMLEQNLGQLWDRDSENRYRLIDQPASTPA